MPPKGTAPASIQDALNTIATNITQAMVVPDAGPHLKFLEALQKAVLGQIHGGGQQGAPGGAPGAPPGGAPAGPAQPPGTNIRQVMGGAPQPPTAGMDPEMMRRMMAQQQDSGPSEEE